jgi:hypothetical protein
VTLNESIFGTIGFVSGIVFSVVLFLIFCGDLAFSHETSDPLLPDHVAVTSDPDSVGARYGR